jgi:type VI secretion system FHA domain protein
MVRRPGSAAPPAPAKPVEEPYDDEATMVRRPGSAAPPAAAKPVEEPFDDEATMVRRPGSAAPPAPAKPVKEPFDDEATMVRRPGSAAPPAPAKPVEEPFDDEATMVRRPGTTPPAPDRSAQSAAPAPVRAARASGIPAVDAFLEGAGLPNLAIADPQAFMRDSGALVRAAVEGLAKLMAARAETRKEIGVGTDEAGEGDNLLAGMSGADEILAFLFDPKRPAIPGGGPAQTLGEACDDLRAHQVALSAAMKAAVAGAVARLDPKAIERDHGTSLGGLNLTRKSKLWDLSIEQHEKLAQAMLGDFGAAFGREILAAYTAQVRKAHGR